VVEKRFTRGSSLTEQAPDKIGRDQARSDLGVLRSVAKGSHTATLSRAIEN